MKTKLDFARELQERTRVFAIRMIRFVKALPKAVECDVIGEADVAAGTVGCRQLSGGMPGEVSRGFRLKNGDDRRGS